MAADNPFVWSDPRTWPWIVYVWSAMFLAGWIKPVWRWLQQQRSQSWPTAQGKIEEAKTEPEKQFFFFKSSREKAPGFIAELTYSYRLGGTAYAGRFRREFRAEEEAEEFVRDLVGRSAIISHNPRKPSKYILLNDAITTLLAERAPAPETIRSTAANLPSWIKPLLWPLILLSAVGLGLSLWIHFGAVAGRKVAPEPFFAMLHVGIFIVWFPAVIVANRRVGKPARKDYWDAVFRGSPAWFKYAIYAFVGYAVLNFLIFIPQAPGNNHAQNGETPVIVWRGFSGHWMAFYSAALAILYSAVRTPSESKVEPPQQAQGAGE